MRRLLVVLLFLSVPMTFFFVAALKADDNKGVVATPLMREVNPDVAKAGDKIEISGEFLDKDHVAEVYLTAGEFTIRVEVLSQTASKILFVAPKAGPGRLRLMVLTKAAQPILVEQPVTLQID